MITIRSALLLLLINKNFVGKNRCVCYLYCRLADSDFQSLFRLLLLRLQLFTLYSNTVLCFGSDVCYYSRFFFFISPLLQALLGMLLQSCGGAFKECSKNHFLNQCARNFVCAAAMHCTSRAALAGLSVLSLHRQCCTSGLFWKNPTNFHFQSPIRVEYPSQQRLILLCFCCGDPFFIPVS